jgi:hypothetical protein
LAKAYYQIYHHPIDFDSKITDFEIRVKIHFKNYAIVVITGATYCLLMAYYARTELLLLLTPTILHLLLVEMLEMINLLLSFHPLQSVLHPLT